MSHTKPASSQAIAVFTFGQELAGGHETAEARRLAGRQAILPVCLDQHGPGMPVAALGDPHLSPAGAA
ncbi:hypothetical protein JO965_41395 (plasmid) [Microvirga sp. VF16]|nr:hypothetical protein JO965_41395 [Microvirga sp. VF16]